jgi:hypothetical protein
VPINKTSVASQLRECAKRGYGSVHWPFALERKYPHADKEWIWQYVFPAIGMTRDPRTNLVRRYHLHESGVQKALKQAVRSAGIMKGCVAKMVRCGSSIFSSLALNDDRLTVQMASLSA